MCYKGLKTGFAPTYLMMYSWATVLFPAKPKEVMSPTRMRSTFSSVQDAAAL